VARRDILPAVRGGRSWTAAAPATAALAGLALAPAALALPGDPGFTATSPADGATLPVDADGIPVAFTCPLYRISDAGGGFVQYGGGDDYGVSFARAATLGPDGRLVDVVALGTGRVVPGTQDQCTSALAAGGGTRPQETRAPTSGRYGGSASAARPATRPAPCAAWSCARPRGRG
jgi:hypothetical protein